MIQNIIIMKNVAFLFLVSFLFFISCSKDGSVVPPELIPDINFSDLEIGQTSSFVGYYSTCSEYQDNFEFRKDTLMLKVSAQEGATFTIEEYYTPYSESYINGQTAVLEYEMTYQFDYLLIPERGSSQLFWFYANDTLQLQPGLTVNLQQESCTLFNDSNLFIGNDIGKVQEFEIGTEMIRNKYGVSCVPGWFNVDAYLIYDESGLFASHVVQSGSAVLGWKLLRE